MSNTENLRGIYAAFAAGDMNAMFGACAPDLEWTELAGGVYGGTYRGADEIVKMFMKVKSEWEYYRVLPGEFFPAGETVFVLGNYDAKHRATGKSFQAPFAHVWTIREGKAATFQTFSDTALQHAAIT